MQAQGQSLGSIASTGSYVYSQQPRLFVTKRDGSRVQFEEQKLYMALQRAASRAGIVVSTDDVFSEVIKTIYDGIATDELEKAMVLGATAFIEYDPAYDKLAKQLLLQRAYRMVFGASITQEHVPVYYKQAFKRNIQRGVDLDILDERLLQFDFDILFSGMVIERDQLLGYLGLQTLFERYFMKDKGQRLELPQTFWMRVAMGLALDEVDKEARALEFYHVFSTLRYIPSTPTLFHAGYKIAQLSSCYLSTISDDLRHIFKVIGDNAQLAKWAGGIGNDWTNIRGTGSIIKKIHATSQGIIPFMKLANDVVIAITRSGIRRGGTCGYLETWHIDFEDFLDLRRNTGDERRRTHDMNTANWIPDLFMKRVSADKEWSFFSPHEVPDLHDLYGAAFEQRYVEYEEMGRQGKLEHYKTISAVKLWRKMLTRLFETGHPWITFKDPCNVRSPQDHVGIVHSSNLCTEITLNTSEDETAVCNLGSINLEKIVTQDGIDEALLAETITTAIRMLDNVIDLNFYPTDEAKNANIRHRAIGVGMMGFQDALFKLDIPFGSQRAIEFADTIAEMYSYYAILASSQLAKERGPYSTFKGSKWDRGIFPLDTIELLEQERGSRVEVSRTVRMNWDPIREIVKLWGIRNSNLMAVAPTATISNIAGCYPCIEPMYKNLYVKANITGEFTIVNKYLVDDLKRLDLWDKEMLDQIKFYDGDIQAIPAIPEHLKEKYAGAFDIDPIHLLKITAARGKWIDQSQSHNVFLKGVSGKKMHDVYMSAWRMGLKTTYYLRTLGASQIEKSTLDTKYGFTQKRTIENKAIESLEIATDTILQVGAACNPFDESCESCQ
jgi:ribonucleoside-diphosphate reductase alpha chain